MAARDKAKKLLESKQRAAALYVNGPERVRGDWAAVNRLLGLDLDPNDEDVKRFVAEEGGDESGLVPPIPASSNGKAGDFESPDVGSIPSAGILNERKTDDEWCRLAKELEPTIKGIADGTIVANAAQAGTVKHIMERCYGRVQERQSEKRPASGVIVLPALGGYGGLTLCPRCAAEFSDDDLGCVNKCKKESKDDKAS